MLLEKQILFNSSVAKNIYIIERVFMASQFH